MGDFYELFYDDAVTVSRELQLTLTARDRERQQPMCGVPYHAVEQYLTRLLRKGYRIAICDQMEDPKLTKKIVRREVTRVLSPGTALDAALGQEQNNFLAALLSKQLQRAVRAQAEPRSCAHGAARCFDRRVSHGGVSGSERAAAGGGRDSDGRGERGAVASSAELPAQLERIPARTRVEDWVWTRDFAVPLVERQLNVRSLEGFGLVGHRRRRLRPARCCTTCAPRRRTRRCTSIR